MTLINRTDRIEESEVEKSLNICDRVAKINREKYGDNKPGFYIETFGCQQNEADSERLAGMCVLMGYQPADTAEGAKLILLNTCAIREHAEKRALSIIGETGHRKKEDPETVIGVGGCMVTQSHRAEKIKMSYPYVSFTFDTGAIHLLPELVLDALTGKKRRFVISDNYGISEGIPTYRKESFKAWLSVMYGCNNFCSYCIVPYVRGRERSRRPEDILEEARGLIEGGAKDITLLGQNVNSYGKDAGYMDIASLMREICKIPGDFRVRFMTSHPKDASDELIRVIAEEEKVAKHFHLPIQSGSNDVLSRMNRKYTVEKYLEIIEKIKAWVPGVSITSDIIVGFPGETEKDFEATMELLKKVRFDLIFSFIYSPRKGTPAAEMENQIPAEISS
ncbi:MAG: tRNA (N6-isopentenyl adenosine(37)-C2)-methylthiotransferase MiaB, partial [Clostridia bacterium]|nr:tRNA (N6-isopentenyl adenosine(37)-C2)-methylthiotransferase MiaB [Clostridia bacterium]